MKLHTQLFWTALAAAWAPALCAQFPTFACGERLSTITIQSDGACLLRTETFEPRWRVQGGGGAAPPKGAADAELAENYRRSTERSWLDLGPGVRPGIERVEARAGEVRMVWTNQFPSIKSMLEEGAGLLERAGWEYKKLRVEQETNGNLRLTLVTTEQFNMARGTGAGYIESMENTRSTTEHRLVFPGRVVSSGLPSTEGSATWWRVDWADEQTLWAARNLACAERIVVVAQAGGLKLPGPVESVRDRNGRARPPKPNAASPVADAAPGYLIEARSISVTTERWFPGVSNSPGYASLFDPNKRGVVVRAALCVPKENVVKSVESARVLRAVDDQGREIKPAPVDEGEGGRDTDYGREGPQVLGLDLRLGVPAPDAQGIEELEGEVVMSTASQWRDLCLTNVCPGSTNSFDLGALIPGARFSAAELKSTGRETAFKATLTGPPAIRDLLFALPEEDEPWLDIRSSESGARSKDGLTIRRVFVVVAKGWAGRRPAPVCMTLRLRVPEVRRLERFRFKLTGLDLFEGGGNPDRAEQRAKNRPDKPQTPKGPPVALFEPVRAVGQGVSYALKH